MSIENMALNIKELSNAKKLLPICFGHLELNK